MKKTAAIALFAALLLSGCANELYSDLHFYMKEKKLPAPSEKSFPHCEGYGCPTYKNVELNAADWAKIERTFGSKAKNAYQER